MKNLNKQVIKNLADSANQIKVEESKKEEPVKSQVQSKIEYLRRLIALNFN